MACHMSLRTNYQKDAYVDLNQSLKNADMIKNYTFFLNKKPVTMFIKVGRCTNFQNVESNSFYKVSL